MTVCYCGGPPEVLSSPFSPPPRLVKWTLGSGVSKGRCAGGWNISRCNVFFSLIRKLTDSLGGLERGGSDHRHRAIVRGWGESLGRGEWPMAAAVWAEGAPPCTPGARDRPVPGQMAVLGALLSPLLKFYPFHS